MKRLKENNKKNKKRALLTGLVTTMFLMGRTTIVKASPNTIENPYIDQSKAIKIVMDDAGFHEKDVEIIKAKLDHDDGMVNFDVEFIYNDVKYEYELNAVNGDILQTEQEELNKNEIPDSKKQTQEKAGIGLKAAKKKALADAKLSDKEVVFTKALYDYDEDNEIPDYDIEFIYKNKEYDYEINAKTGKIIEKSIESIESNVEIAGNEADDSKSKVNAVKEKYISITSAKNISLKHAGLSKSQVNFTKEKLECDDGSFEYEIEFYYNEMEYEYSIDAVNGTILEYNMESID